MSSPVSEGTRQNVTALRLVFATIGVVAFYLGWVGLTAFVRKQVGAGYDRLDVPYYDAQLFVLGAEPLQNGGPYPWQLEVARFLAPLFTLLTVVETARVLLATELRRFRARRARGHVLICGDTPFAKTLANQLFAEGRRIVVVRSVPFGQLELRHRRMLGVAGDPTSMAVLRGAGLHRARTVYVCTEDDERNHAISIAASRLLQDLARPAWVYVQVHDQEMCQSLQARRLGSAGSNRLRLDYFHVDEVAARALYQLHPLTPAQGRPTRILIVGDAPFRRSLLVETARFWRSVRPAPQGPLRVDLVARDATGELAALSGRFPFLRTACAVEAHDQNIDTLVFADELMIGYDRIFLCLADEQRALDLALTTPALWRGAHESVFVPLHRQAALAEAFHGEPKNDLLDEVNGKLRLYPILTRACDANLISDDLTERLARQIHEEYRLTLRQRSAAAHRGPAAVAWSQLPESLRSANRAQVQDISNKMVRLGCVVAPRKGGGGEPIGVEQVEELARSEHDRWCAERRGSGWQYGGVRDDDRRRHPDLLPWDELGEDARNKNRDAIRRLPEALADAGFEIVRITPHDQTVVG
jgi:voltage-gated potassium channel Kch